LRTVQKSILGPIIFAIFIATPLDQEEMLSFADDFFVPKSNSSIDQLVINM
jgi:hypothetical protein